MKAMSRLRARLTNEEGIALVIALMAMMLLTALGAAVVMVSRTETAIANNYRNSQEALYAADAAIDRVVQDLLMVPRWNDMLAGTTISGFIDGASGAPKILPGGGTLTLTSATTELQSATDTANLWGANNPQWRLFAWGPLRDVASDLTIDSPMYVAVWVADDPAETDGNPLADTNGTLTLHAEAIGPSGTRKVIEVTVARTSGTEIERGQIAQRGQEELNQRARKAAVQTPGKTLTNMRMNTATGTLGVQ
ncbi:MAG: pilus assembly PilX N-terminal domain-containing protein [Vicinamibacterales bacterium]